MGKAKIVKEFVKTAEVTAVESTEKNTTSNLNPMEETVSKENTDKKPNSEATTNEKFAMSFVMSKEGFANSYLVATQGKETRQALMSRIVPKTVQHAIMASLASTGKAPAELVTPEDMIKSLASQGVDTLDKFVAAMEDLEKAASESESAKDQKDGKAEGEKKEAAIAVKAAQSEPLMAVNESEMSAPAKKARGEAPLSAHKEEGVVGVETVSAPKTDAQKYWAHAFKPTGGEPLLTRKEASVNPETAMLHARIAALKKEAEQQRRAAEEAAADAKAKSLEVDKLKADKALDQAADTISNLVEDMKKKHLIDDARVKAVTSILKKMDEKGLGVVSELIREMAKEEMGEKGKMPKSLDDMSMPFGEEEKIKGPKLPMPAKKASFVPHIQLEDKKVEIPTKDANVNDLHKIW